MGSAEDRYEDYILLLVSDPAEWCKSSIICTRKMIADVREPTDACHDAKLLHMRIHASEGQAPIVWNLQSNKCRVELSDL